MTTSPSVGAEHERLLKKKLDPIVEPYLQRPENVGLALGILSQEGRQVFCYGVRERESATPIHQETLFEIGSITKVMTANLLADMERQGFVSTSDPCLKYLPTELDNPSLNSVTLRQLATHTSGLPRLPQNLEATVQDEANPYTHYQESHLLECLQQVRVKSVGRPKYSNLGVGLLGYLLGRVAGRGYEPALRRYILEPLGLNDTAVELSSEQRARMAQPHDEQGEPTPPWDIPVLGGAGAVRSSVKDMLAFMEANLNAAKVESVSGIIESLRSCQQPQVVPKNESFLLANIAAVVLPASSLALQWAVPIRPGSLWFVATILSPIVLVVVLGRLAHWIVATTLVLGGTYLLWGELFGWTAGLFSALVVAALAQAWRWGPMSRPPRLGWQFMKMSDSNVLWHNGGTGGSASFCALDPECETAVVLLSNSAQSVDDLGIDILQAISSGKKHKQKS